MDSETMLRSAPTTEDGGDLVLFDDNNQFVGQFHTGEEAAACARERGLKIPRLLTLSSLKPFRHTHIDGKLYVF